jgi:hypothetical protein
MKAASTITTCGLHRIAAGLGARRQPHGGLEGPREVLARAARFVRLRRGIRFSAMAGRFPDSRPTSIPHVNRSISMAILPLG